MSRHQPALQQISSSSLAFRILKGDADGDPYGPLLERLRRLTQVRKIQDLQNGDLGGVVSVRTILQQQPSDATYSPRDPLQDNTLCPGVARQRAERVGWLRE
jgi:hypothetical protein